MQHDVVQRRATREGRDANRPSDDDGDGTDGDGARDGRRRGDRRDVGRVRRAKNRVAAAASRDRAALHRRSMERAFWILSEDKSAYADRAGRLARTVLAQVQLIKVLSAEVARALAERDGGSVADDDAASRSRDAGVLESLSRALPSAGRHAERIKSEMASARAQRTSSPHTFFPVV